MIIMKIRNGFVSNSSTSSFVIAIRKPQTPIEEVLLEAINILTKSHTKEYNESTIRSYKSELVTEREETEQDIRFAGDRIKKLSLLLKDKKLTKVLEMAKEFDENLNRHRMNKKYSSWTPQDELDIVEANLKSSLNKLEFINERIVKLNGLDDNDLIVSFDKDQCDYDKINKAFKLFEEHGKVLKVLDADTN